MNIWLKILTGIVILLIAIAVYVFVQVRSIGVEQLSDDLWVLRGLGGNTAVLRTDAGTVVVDTMTFGIQGNRIKDVAAELTGQPTRLIINTHYHFDHTHGNPAFDPGTRVLSTDRTLAYLNTLDQEFWQGEAAQLLPNETFTDRHTLTMGGKTIELVHPGRGHTDGDLVVVFKDEGVIHMGDLMFMQHYPNIDLEAGGSVQAWPATLDRVLELEFDRVIPGHGVTTDRDGIAGYRAFVQQLGEIGSAAAQAGDSLEETLQTTALTADAGYEPIEFILPLGLNREFVLRRSWEEATNNFVRVEIDH